MNKVDNQSNKILNEKPDTPGILSLVYHQQLDDLRYLVNKAKRDRKIFTVVGGYLPIRRALISRGWLEKVRIGLADDCKKLRDLEHLSYIDLIQGMNHPDFSEKYRRALISKLLASHQVDFYWDLNTNPFTINSDKIKQTIINRYPAETARPYENKEVLSDTLNNNSHWFCSGKSNILYPRTFNLEHEYDKRNFIKDFKITAAVSLLKLIASMIYGDDTVKEKPNKNLDNMVDSIFYFAVRQCENFIKIKEHRDIDEVITEAKDKEWVAFLDGFYNLIHNHRDITETFDFSKDQIKRSRFIMRQIERFYPQIKNDGFMNLWILKPHRGSQGHGIVVLRRLKDILTFLQNSRNNKIIAQKYIERPFLIHGIKFDIRQWFLIAHQPKLHVWMYRECYLRFCTQSFNLYTLHEAVHLTNNAVQRKYNVTDRHASIPGYHMWHSERFKDYLNNTGRSKVWDNYIYKGMRECIIGLVMSSQENMSDRINSFELWGTDFMVTEDFQPYLIEVNTRPALYASTPLTAKLSPQVLEDTVKVTVDYTRNKKAATGKFDLIYKDQHYVSNRLKANDDFTINGRRCMIRSKVSKQVPEIQETIVREEDLHDEREKTHSFSIKNVLNIDNHEVKSNVKSTLEKILSTANTNNDPKENEYRQEQFKSLLSEFVNIISTPTVTVPSCPKTWQI